MTRLVVSLILLAACSEDPADPGSDTDTGFGTAVSFAADIEPIAASACASCHTADASGGFANADTHAGWLATSSVGLAYCEAGSPDDSYGYLKLVGAHGDVGGGGTQMPPTGALSASEQALFEAWVLDGCQP